VPSFTDDDVCLQLSLERGFNWSSWNSDRTSCIESSRELDSAVLRKPWHGLCKDRKEWLKSTGYKDWPSLAGQEKPATGFLCVALAHSIDQAVFKLRDPSASFCGVLGWKAGTTPPLCRVTQPKMNSAHTYLLRGSWTIQIWRQPTTGLSTGTPNGGVRRRTEGAEEAWSGINVRGGPWSCKGLMPQCREMLEQWRGSRLVGQVAPLGMKVGGGAWNGGFSESKPERGDNIWNEIKQNNQ
jgi:hypothetical protein